MTELFETYLRTHTTLNTEAIALLLEPAQLRRLRRNEALLQAGQVCRHKTFILDGLLRYYSSSEDGTEAILQFAPEGSWTLDAESYDQQVPSRFSIAAVEPTTVLLWQRSDFQRLLSELPELKQFADRLISRTGYNNRLRLLSALSATPEEKYREFVQHHPDLLRRLPLRMIAAYLGISLKTLTRIRHGQWAR